MTIRVLVADDQIFAVEGLHQIVAGANDMDVVGQAQTILEVLSLAERTQPDAILLDVNWPGDREAGIKMIPRIKERCPNARIIAVSVYPDLVERARGAGAFALDKSFSKADLLNAIRWAVQNEDPTISAPARGGTEALTDREREILKKMTEGHTDKLIAYQLGIAEGTVKKHVSSILSKLQVGGRTEAVAIAVRNRLV